MFPIQLEHEFWERSRRTELSVPNTHPISTRVLNPTFPWRWLQSPTLLSAAEPLSTSLLPHNYFPADKAELTEGAVLEMRSPSPSWLTVRFGQVSLSPRFKKATHASTSRIESTVLSETLNTPQLQEARYDAPAGLETTFLPVALNTPASKKNTPWHQPTSAEPLNDLENFHLRHTGGLPHHLDPKLLANRHVVSHLIIHDLSSMAVVGPSSPNTVTKSTASFNNSRICCSPVSMVLKLIECVFTNTGSTFATSNAWLCKS